MSEYEHTEHLREEVERIREENFYLRENDQRQKQYIKWLERNVALLRIHCNHADVSVVDSILRGEEEAKP